MVSQVIQYLTKDEVIAYLKELKEFRENPLKPASDSLKNARVVIGFYAKLLQTRTHDRAIDLAERKFRILPSGD